MMDPPTARSAAGEAAAKRARIVDAARTLFLQYGFRRTSVDDVARVAGIAKGTVYLSFASKDALFAAVAERITDEAMEHAVRASLAAKGTAGRVTAILDATIGGPARLVQATGHAEELLEAKRDAAVPVIARYDRGIASLLDGVLVEGGIRDANAAAMLVAAAYGLLKVSRSPHAGYDARLAHMVGVLLAGLSAVAEAGTAPADA